MNFFKLVSCLLTLFFGATTFAAEKDYKAELSHFSCDREGLIRVDASLDEFEITGGLVTSSADFSDLKMQLSYVSKKDEKSFCKFSVDIFLDGEISLAVADATSVTPESQFCNDSKAILDDVFSFFPYGFYSRPQPRVTLGASFITSKNVCPGAKQLWANFNITSGF